MTIPVHFHFRAEPVAIPGAVVNFDSIRFTVLTPRLIRMEYSPENVFEDKASQVFWFRKLQVPNYNVIGSTGQVEIITDDLHLKYQLGKPFSSNTLSVTLRKTGVVWHYGEEDNQNLKGTGRTLDEANGPILLEDGLISRSGWCVVNDTHNLVFNEKGWIENRNVSREYQDVYFFGYGTEYQLCLNDYCRVSGPTPVVPRWILGNWWSHYWEYSQEELIDLMEDFKKNEVPLSVCIIDMDWHITQTGNACSGWTGYTWNRELFPDPKQFLATLHRLGLKASLNLHPAEGIHSHEEMYAEMAKAMGINPESKEPVPFDLENPDFVEPYFKFLHHPKEAEGIDFWWMDWQQGNPSRIRGLNLLWWINHIHYLDLGRGNTKRSFVFSRWGGLGNHRYPIGFSGDSIVSWESLAFQPYMTATAANVGFGWWSHDIGGHMRGIEEDELYARWVQFGVFSPILRLHCTKNPFHDRRPWGHNLEVFHVSRQAMQLRHALIPYLYSMAWRNYKKNISLVQPMYYQYPDAEEAYNSPNQYFFGSELIAAPFVSPIDPDTRLARQMVWLPKGNWFNFFSGQFYRGDAWYVIYGSLHDIPVFAKAGGLIPMGSMQGWGGVETPNQITLHIFPGAENSIELFDDDGVSMHYQEDDYAITPISQNWSDNKQILQVGSVEGNARHVPAQREFVLVFHSIKNVKSISVQVDGVSLPCEQNYDSDTHDLIISKVILRPANRLKVELETDQLSLLEDSDHKIDILYRMIKAFRSGTETKRHLSLRLNQILVDPSELAAFQVALTPSQIQALLEVITESGIERNLNTGEDVIFMWNNLESKFTSFLTSMEVEPGTRPRKFYSLDKGKVPQFKVFKIAHKYKYPVLIQFNYGEILRTSVSL